MPQILQGKHGYYIKTGIAVITLAIAVFDLFSDWFAFRDFVRFNAGKLTAAFGFFCGISTLVFILEIRNCIVAIKLYRHEKDVEAAQPSKAMKKLERWQEIVGFLLMIFEDLPNTVILYMAFRFVNCELFLRLFEESFTANLALLGAFLSSLWKLLLSIRYCCCNCCNYHDMQGCGKKCCCCCARIFRPIFAIVLMGFAAFLYFTFNNQGVKYREDCFIYTTGISSTTVADV